MWLSSAPCIITACQPLSFIPFHSSLALFPETQFSVSTLKVFLSLLFPKVISHLYLYRQQLHSVFSPISSQAFPFSINVHIHIALASPFFFILPPLYKPICYHVSKNLQSNYCLLSQKSHILKCFLHYIYNRGSLALLK